MLTIDHPPRSARSKLASVTAGRNPFECQADIMLTLPRRPLPNLIVGYLFSPLLAIGSSVFAEPGSPGEQAT
jgi:hypothetical protein